MLKEGINGFCMALADSAPGVSGGTVAFIMGFYDQFICSIHDFAFGNIKEKRSALCYLAKLGVGWAVGMILAVLAGAVTVVKAIKVCLERFRPQAVYMILGMMIGSFYAIIQGPTTLEMPKAAMNLGNFQVAPCLVGVALVTGMQMIKERSM